MTERERQNQQALGGMRNPSQSIRRQPGTANPGWMVRELCYKAQQLWPSLAGTAAAILEGREAKSFDVRIVDALRSAVLGMLNSPRSPRRRTVRASTPLHSSVISAWGTASGDEDSPILAEWLDHGAPLGFSQDITTSGVFPVVPAEGGEDEGQASLLRSLEGWQNYQSAEEERQDLLALIEDYTKRGFCHKIKSIKEAERELGRAPILNKLGVVTKVTPAGKKKSRIIWDLKESRANSICHQKERILLPRLLDLAQHALWTYRQGEDEEVWLAAVDIKDAFMNIPAGSDKYATVAAVENDEGKYDIIVFDTLVFGSRSSPTLWGRYAAWLGRSSSAISPTTGLQIYVDDPAMVLTGSKEAATRELTNLLLWFGITGFPVKLDRAEGGKFIHWVGASVEVDDQVGEVTVSIPTDKVEKLQKATSDFLKRPVVGRKQLRSYAGGLSFVAGLIPHLRPFLATIWAVLGGSGGTNDGAHLRPSGKLLHTRRIRPALLWVRALLKGEPAPLTRVLTSRFTKTRATIITDASPWGIGGVLRINEEAVECFAEPIPKEVLDRFKAQVGLSKFNTLWEGLALLVAFRTWLPSLGYGAQVRARSDNLGVLFMIANGKATSAELNVLAREFALDQALQLYRINWLSHIPGLTNLEADALSRQFAPNPPSWPTSLANAKFTSITVGSEFWRVGQKDV